MKLFKLLNILTCSILLTPSWICAANFNQTIIGKGDAIIEGDVTTVQTIAFENAKKNAVLSAMNRLLGIQVNESDEIFSGHIGQIIDQFGAFAQITDEKATRDGARFKKELTIKMDETAFRSLLKDLGIGLNQKARDIGTIVVFFDEIEKPYDHPTDRVNESIEYKRDNSVAQYEKEKLQSSDNLKINTSGMMDASIHNQSSGGTASSQLNEQIGISSALKASSEVANVIMDQESYSYKKEYKEIKEAPISSSYTKAGLQENLKQYGIDFVEASGILAEFSQNIHKSYTSYTEVLNSEDATKFREFVREKTKADYMGIAFSQIGYADRPDNLTGKYSCSTLQSNLSIYGLKDNKLLDAAALETVKQAAVSVDNCKNNARSEMAKNLGQVIGLKLQTTIRDASRDFIGVPTTYQLILQGKFDRTTRTGFQKMLDGMTSNIKSYKLISQDDKEIVYELSYSGKQEIGDAILDRAISTDFIALKPIFERYDMKKMDKNIIMLYPTN